MEDGAHAYHLVVSALEDRAGISPAERFAMAISHAIHGHLPHRRYRRAASDRRKAGAGAESVDRSVARWMAVDLNPLVRSLGALRSHANAIWAYNTYNAHAGLGVRMSVEAAGEGLPARVARRELLTPMDDPELCAVGNIAALERALGIAGLNRSRAVAEAPGIVDVGRLLGVESSASFHVAEALRGLERVDLDEAARRLGASRRSLQRKLAEESSSFEAIRSAHRIVAATDMLRGSAPLAEVAWSCGFADLPHMTRALRASCGMTPGLLRAILHGGVEPEADIGPRAAGNPQGNWRMGSTDIGPSGATIPPEPAKARDNERRDR